jgi:hypothetical protein
VAVVQRLGQSGRCSQFIPTKLLSVLENWGSSWSLQTGGCCSEVAVNTGLTVFAVTKIVGKHVSKLKSQINQKKMQKPNCNKQRGCQESRE